MRKLSPLTLALVAAGGLSMATTSVSAGAQSPKPDAQQAGELAVTSLKAGDRETAIEQLESEREATPQDPAVLINLGIAYAQLGKDNKARAMFQKAMSSPDPIDLFTADGRVRDSRLLAREALRMLEAGEFRSEDKRS